MKWTLDLADSRMMQRQCWPNKALLNQQLSIIFMYNTDKSRYGRIIKEKENDVLEGKDNLPKTVSETCWVLGG